MPTPPSEAAIAALVKSYGEELHLDHVAQIEISTCQHFGNPFPSKIMLHPRSPA